MKILIIDDNAEIASIIQKFLEIEGYRVTTARDGNDGYSAYLDFKPDLVITDIQMPGKNGFQLMKEIRMHDPKIKTIYITGHMNQFQSRLEDEKERYQADFLAKPFAREELMSLVSKNLGQGVALS
ncbi:MAG: response regulator [Deltaproteobacteria bacterium]|nr:response regulator [Deltaproteobacteria bacterium]MBW2330663.1 response regulator [Deltaproteobacteria bacterium]